MSDKIIVRVNKRINTAFQKWLFAQGFVWGGTNKTDVSKHFNGNDTFILHVYTTDNIITWSSEAELRNNGVSVGVDLNR